MMFKMVWWDPRFPDKKTEERGDWQSVRYRYPFIVHVCFHICKVYKLVDGEWKRWRAPSLNPYRRQE